MMFETLFYLMNEKHCVLEVKRTDIAEDSAPENLYYWLSISTESKKVDRLVFVSMGEEVVKGNKMQVRTFEDGELRFDNSFAKFVHKNDGHILMNCSEEKVPENVLQIVNNFITES